MDRSTLSLPFHLRNLPESSRPRRRLSDRSALQLPPELLRVKSSRPSDAQPRPGDNEYDILSLIQYISDFPKDDNFKTEGFGGMASYPVTGRGRTYEVRRYSEGNRKDIDVHDHWRDSQALKCLRVSLTENDKSANSYRYRSLIQELRILRHRPLSKHPNLLRVNGIAWERNGDDFAAFLPLIRTEFATLGTLDTFLSSWQIPYANQKRRLILDVAEGLSALHECSIVHGDVKSENILVLISEDTSYPFIAKLSDFGFSLDTSSTDEPCGQLVGYTPLWAAPEAASQLQYSAMFLTDVYSFGFVIWSIVANGQSLFDGLSDLPQDPQDRFEAFNSLKLSDQLLASVVHQIFCTGERESDVDYGEIFEFLSATLRLNPSERNSQCILASLRHVCPRGNDAEIFHHVQPEPLPAFDHRKIDFNPMTILSYYPSHLGCQIQKQLEEVALSDPPPNELKMYRVEDPTFPWRHPSQFCTRPAGAAFALFNQHFLGAKSDEAISRAVPWLKLSADHGYPIAMALCSQLDEQWSVGLAKETRLSWLRWAAEGGSNPALAVLKNTLPENFRECLRSWRETFWPHCHGVSHNLLTKLRSCPQSICTEDSDLSPMSIPQNVGEYDDSLLHLAAMIGSTQLVGLFLERNRVDINKRNARGESPLFLACRSGHTAVVDVLLDLGADPTVSNIYNENCLHWLISFDDDAVFEYAWKFLERGVDLHQSATLDTSFSDNIARKFFLRTVAGTPLHRAVEAGNRLVVQVLLDLGAESLHLSRNFTPLCRAAMNHHVDILRLILSHPLSADIDTPYLNKAGSHRFTHLSRAVRTWEDLPLLFYINDRYDYSTVAEALCILVTAGATINNSPTDMLGLTLSRRNYLATNFVISNGYDGLERRFPELQTGAGAAPTALHLALFAQDFNMVDVLLKHGSNVSAEMSWYNDGAVSTLQICARSFLKNFEIASRLIEAGAEVNHVASQDHLRETALSRALILNDFGFADFLLANGASASYVPPFWPPLSCIKSVIVNTDHGKSLYRALEFLINHPKAQLPFWTCQEMRLSIFHSIFSRTEIRLKFTDSAGLQALFRLLRQQFPDVEMLDIPDVFGSTALHCAVYNANVTGVKLLLEAGCDKQRRATPSDEWFQRIAREALDRQKQKVGSDVIFNDEDYGEAAEEIKAEMLPPYAGKSVVEMAQADMFFDIPSFARDNTEELDEYLRRRIQIKEILCSW